VLTVEQVYVIAGARGIGPPCCSPPSPGLRWGELMALRRSQLDLDGEGVVKVCFSLSEVDGKFIEGHRSRRPVDGTWRSLM
jgi:hypothetical protein